VRLTTRIRPFSDAEVVEGRVTDRQREAWARQVREARIEAARRNDRWTEIEAVDLVPRGRGLLVSATTDAVFKAYAGTVFQSGSVSMVSELAPLYFAVRGEELEFFEREPGTWSERVARQAARR
jgi:hypothetical protein